MKLSSRLEAVANFVPYSSILLDVGTDHAWLPIYLLEQCQIRKAYASDNKIGPLNIANKNICTYHFENLIKTINSDGFLNIDELILNELNCITISGMGGILICNILSQNKLFPYLNNKTLIIQPNSNSEEVRRKIVELGFTVIDECLVYEDSHYYEIIMAKPGDSEYEELDYKYGPILRREKSPYFYDYMNKKLDDLNQILESIDNEESPKYQDTKNKMLEISRVIEF